MGGETTKAELASVIRRLLVDYKSHSGLSPTRINQGHCWEFGEDVLDELGVRPSETEPVLNELGAEPRVRHDAVVDCVVENFAEMAEGGRFVRWLRDELLLTYGMRPPEGWAWDELDLVGRGLSMDSGTHLWLVFDRHFYDAEAPDGVQSFFDLPYFKRVLKRWRSKNGNTTIA